MLKDRQDSPCLDNDGWELQHAHHTQASTPAALVSTRPPRFLTPGAPTVAARGTGEGQEPGRRRPSGGTAVPEHRHIPRAAGWAWGQSIPSSGHSGQRHPAAPLGKNMNRLSRQRDKTRVSQHRRVNPPQQITLAPLGKSHGNQSMPSVPSHCMLSALCVFPYNLSIC